MLSIQPLVPTRYCILYLEIDLRRQDPDLAAEIAQSSRAEESGVFYNDIRQASQFDRGCSLFDLGHAQGGQVKFKANDRNMDSDMVMGMVMGMVTR